MDLKTRAWLRPPLKGERRQGAKMFRRWGMGVKPPPLIELRSGGVRTGHGAVTDVNSGVFHDTVRSQRRSGWRKLTVLSMTPLDDDYSSTIFSVGTSAPAPADVDTLGHYLVAIDGTEPGLIVEIDREPLTIGRDTRQGLVFADTALSRLHARVTRVGAQLLVEDCGSTNGTTVDGVRIGTPALLDLGGVIQLGRQTLKFEQRSRREVERAQELRRDLQKARTYVLSLLPGPLETGPVLARWQFHPSAQLGGDAFGYYWVDQDTFVLYLLDVSGHGAGAAMLSVTVLNVLRQRALPGVDFGDPSQVLSSLNDRFQMDSHDGMYFTIWYGVYRVPARTLNYAVAGHHAAYLVPADRSISEPLGRPDLMIGAVPDLQYEMQQVEVPVGSTLHLFSDGVFEVVTKEGGQWTLADFLPHLLDPAASGGSGPEHLHAVVKSVARPGPFDDDFSLVTVTFQ